MILSLGLLFATAAGAETETPLIGPDFWASPRHGEIVMVHPAVRESVDRLLRERESYLVIRVPEGEMGELWGHELKAWLAALGVSSGRVEVAQDAELLESVALVVEGAAREEEPVSSEVDGTEGSDAVASEEDGAEINTGAAESDAQDEEAVEVTLPEQEMSDEVTTADEVSGAGEVEAEENAQKEITEQE